MQTEYLNESDPNGAAVTDTGTSRLVDTHSDTVGVWINKFSHSIRRIAVSCRLSTANLSGKGRIDHKSKVDLPSDVLLGDNAPSNGRLRSDSTRSYR